MNMFRLGISVSGWCCLMSARWQGETCWHRVGIVGMVDMASGSMLGLWLDLRCSTEFSVFSSSGSSWESVVDPDSGSTFSKLWISTIKACWKTWVATLQHWEDGANVWVSSFEILALLGQQFSTKSSGSRWEEGVADLTSCWVDRFESSWMSLPVGKQKWSQMWFQSHLDIVMKMTT